MKKNNIYNNINNNFIMSLPINKELLKIFIESVKSKSQIKSLENTFIEKIINIYLMSNPSIKKKIEIEYQEKKEKIEKSKHFKEIIKHIRMEIGNIYGQFLTEKFSKKSKILEKTLNYEELLLLHKSSRERLQYYQEIYTKIFTWKTPNKIADLACGLNPISYPILKEVSGKNIEYFATDLNPDDMNFLNNYFKKNNYPAKAKALDISNPQIFKEKEIQNAEMIFLFKALDSIEEIKKNISKEFLKNLNPKYIVVSFPTKSIKAKQQFKNTRKGWLRKLIDDNNWNFEEFEIDNEIFFLIEKK